VTIVSLNTWGGKLLRPLLDYIADGGRNTDVFCFQEVYDSARDRCLPNGASSQLLRQIAGVLPNYVPVFAPSTERDIVLEGASLPVRYGLATFVRNEYSIRHVSTTIIFDPTRDARREPRRDMQRNMVVTVLDDPRPKHTGSIAIANLHGQWVPGWKYDTASRLAQARRILSAAHTWSAPAVICGDFNLRPDTGSMRLLARHYRNLVVEFGVTTTRSELYNGPEKYADYILVDKGVGVEAFSVDGSANVSDHAPFRVEVVIQSDRSRSPKAVVV